jgi:hypothetical protein
MSSRGLSSAELSDDLKVTLPALTFAHRSSSRVGARLTASLLKNDKRSLQRKTGAQLP